jgi:hypothetical protein
MGDRPAASASSLAAIIVFTWSETSRHHAADVARRGHLDRQQQRHRDEQQQPDRQCHHGHARLQGARQPVGSILGAAPKLGARTHRQEGLKAAAARAQVCTGLDVVPVARGSVAAGGSSSPDMLPGFERAAAIQARKQRTCRRIVGCSIDGESQSISTSDATIRSSQAWQRCPVPEPARLATGGHGGSTPEMTRTRSRALRDVVSASAPGAPMDIGGPARRVDIMEMVRERGATSLFFRGSTCWGVLPRCRQAVGLPGTATDTDGYGYQTWILPGERRMLRASALPAQP